MSHKRKALRQEVGKFSFVGIISTTIDFILFNLCTLLFGLPIILANIISATLSGVVSFRLNKRLTFNGQRHGHARTLLRYVVIVGASIYLIQNLILYLVGNHFDYPTTVTLAALEQMGFPNLNDQTVSNNVAKLCAVYIASVWNFFLLRRFVFVPSHEKAGATHSNTE